MYCVYVLQSKRDGRLYTGFTKDLESRLKKHAGGNVYTTKRMGNVELIYYEMFKAKSDAMRREKYLKTTKGKRTLKIMLKDSLVAFV